MIDFASPQHLAQWLLEHDVNLDRWGRGEAKSVADLWLELVNGESTLSESPLLRRVQVAELLIQRDGHTLVEAEQVMVNGELRQRNHLPAEKMKAAETPLQAAQRGLIEELAIDPAQATALTIEIVQTTGVERSSPSYPGLNTEYLLHRAKVSGLSLPVDDFLIENQTHRQGDPVKSHQWRWVKDVTARESTPRCQRILGAD